MTNSDIEKTLSEYSGKNFAEFKDNLSQVLIEKIYPISIEIKKLLNDTNYLDTILSEGFEKADQIATKKIKKFTKYWVFKKFNYKFKFLINSYI